MGDFEYRIVRDLLWSLRRARRVSSVGDLAEILGVRTNDASEIALVMCGWTRGLSRAAVEAALLEELGSSLRLVAVRG